MSKRTAALTLTLATVAVATLVAVLLWRWLRRERAQTIDVPGVGRVRLEPDKRKRDAWQAWADRRAREAGNGSIQ